MRNLISTVLSRFLGRKKEPAKTEDALASGWPRFTKDWEYTWWNVEQGDQIRPASHMVGWKGGVQFDNSGNLTHRVKSNPTG